MSSIFVSVSLLLRHVFNSAKTLHVQQLFSPKKNCTHLCQSIYLHALSLPAYQLFVYTCMNKFTLQVYFLVEGFFQEEYFDSYRAFLDLIQLMVQQPQGKIMLNYLKNLKWNLVNKRKKLLFM